MGSAVVKRSVVIAGHKTSVSLEDNFWAGLKFVAGEKSLTLSELLAAIDEQRQQDNLSSAIRQFLFDYYVSLVTRLKHDSEQVNSLPPHSPPPAGKPSRSS
jgi:predicted DNA-binding ribbon-helix-helix protein